MANLAEVVTKRLANLDTASGTNRKSMDRAIALADLYSHVKPQEYILPLNAMAGFCGPYDK